MKFRSICFTLLCLLSGFSKVLDADLVGKEEQLMKILSESYVANQNNRLATDIINDNHMKQLLSKHNMPDSVTFFEELESILISYMDWYFICVQRPSIISYGDTFIENEMLKNEKPQSSMKCEPCVLFNDFMTYLKDEHEKHKNLNFLIDFLNEPDNEDFRSQLTNALIGKLKITGIIEKKTIEERSFYNDLFEAITEEEKWFYDIVDKFIKWYENMYGILNELKVVVEKFFLEIHITIDRDNQW